MFGVNYFFCYALTRRFSAMTLCNLSTHADCKSTLVSLHGLPPLIEMLEGESDLVKRYAAMTLCNLSTLAVNQVRYEQTLGGGYAVIRRWKCSVTWFVIAVSLLKICT